jgi:hypothetical protein
MLKKLTANGQVDLKSNLGRKEVVQRRANKPQFVADWASLG